MQVRAAVVADYASISLGNKLNILGIFTNIYSPSEPITYPQMQVVVQFEFHALEAGPKQVRIVLMDEDGREILSAGGDIAVPNTAGGENAIVNQILVLNNTNFPRFGRYEFRILLNGRTEAEIPLNVVRAQPNQPPLLNA